MSKEFLCLQYKNANLDYKLAINEKDKQNALHEMYIISLTVAIFYGNAFADSLIKK